VLTHSARRAGTKDIKGEGRDSGAAKNPKKFREKKNQVLGKENGSRNIVLGTSLGFQGEGPPERGEGDVKNRNRKVG